MIEKEYIELINREIDRDITSEESVRLRRYRASNSEAQRHYEELLRVSRMLSQVEEVDPPPGLKRDVMNAILAGRRPQRTSEGLVRTFVTALTARRACKYAYAFSAGLAAGIALFAVFTGSLTDTRSLDNMSGTIIHGAFPDDLEPAERVEFDLGEAHGAVATRRAGEAVLAQFEIWSPEEIRLVVEFSGEDVSFDGLRQLGSSPMSVDILGNHVQVTHKGDARYVLGFVDHAEALTRLNIKAYTRDMSYEGAVNTGK